MHYWPRAVLVNSNQNRWVLVGSTGILSKRKIKYAGPGRPRRLLITGLLEKSYQELTFACDSLGCYQFRVSAGHLAKQNEC